MRLLQIVGLVGVCAGVALLLPDPSTVITAAVGGVCLVVGTLASGTVVAKSIVRRENPGFALLVLIAGLAIVVFFVVIFAWWFAHPPDS